MGTHSSETLEDQSPELNSQVSPSMRTGSPVNSPGRMLATTGSMPDLDDISGWEDVTEKEHHDDMRLFVGAGFSNLGNTCFLNSILQCFIHTVPVFKAIHAFNHPSPCDGYSEGFCMICVLKKLINKFLASDGAPISPWKLVKNLNYFSSCFHRYQQEDAHEFLQCFLDRLESCCNNTKLYELTHTHYGNLVKQTFGGRLISKIRCCNCGHYSDTYEPLIDLSLEIEDVDSVPAALESFTKVENIEDPETKFTCENCKEQVLIEKQLLLDELPSVATFHLKRFKNDGSVVEKIDKHVQFPLELDLLPYATKNQISEGDSKYHLYAIVVHIGFSACSGHYYCFIRAAPGAWYLFDDSKVTRVRESFVMSQEAYILFYAKQDTPWFSDFIQTQRPTLPKPVSYTSPTSVLDNAESISIPPRMVSVARVSESQENAAPHLYSPPASFVATKSSEAREMPSPLPFEESKRLNNGIMKHQADLILDMPSRSSSPEIYREDSPDNVYSIPRAHLRTGDHNCKRQLQKKLDSDDKRKQALMLVKKSVRGGQRGQQLSAALGETQSESSVGKKRRRTNDSPIRDGKSNAFQRPGFPSGSRPIIARY